MTKHDVAIWDVGEAVRMAGENMSMMEMVDEIVANVPKEKRVVFYTQMMTKIQLAILNKK